MTFKNTSLQKWISGIIIISLFTPMVLFTFQPKKASAQWVVTDPAQVIQTGLSVKDVLKEIARQFLMLAARRLLAQMTQNTINWINGGFHGNPLYIENPRSFFDDIAKTEVKNMVNLFGYDSMKYPFGKEFSLNIINAYQQQLETNAEYSLSRVVNDPTLLNSYRNDFNAGGWNVFLINTQYPQNNYIGFNMLATEELARRVRGVNQTAAQKTNNALQQGLGFLSPQTCPSNPKYNNLKNEFQRPSFKSTTPYSPPKRESFSSDDEWGNAMLAYEAQYSEFVAAEKDVWAEANTCPEGLVATTPGSVVGSHITTAINSKFKQNELAAALGNSLAAILDTLMNHFLSKGLNSLTNAITPETGEECDFEYFGEKLEQCGGDGLPDGTGGGQCVSYIVAASASLRDDVIAAQERALDEDPALAEVPAAPGNVEQFRDLVAGQLNSAGFEASASHNGNCNLSPNNIGVRNSGALVGEIYDVVREDPSMTIREASSALGRPAHAGNASWGFILDGDSGAQPDPSSINFTP
ncbi:DUF4141 domain-containing protein [Candidatus Nomurabacteria bacterium]|nr:DUF4141 domain-containing protein [Candidatus Nomurabacteria bacterium]